LLPSASLDAPIEKKKTAGLIIINMEGPSHWVNSSLGFGRCGV